MALLNTKDPTPKSMSPETGSQHKKESLLLDTATVDPDMK